MYKLHGFKTSGLTMDVPPDYVCTLALASGPCLRLALRAPGLDCSHCDALVASRPPDILFLRLRQGPSGPCPGNTKSKHRRTSDTDFVPCQHSGDKHIYIQRKTMLTAWVCSTIVSMALCVELVRLQKESKTSFISLLIAERFWSRSC